ncbi:MAG: M20/M25/M40 family metallo-hydrolase, partial [Fimbriimonadaceae bacterium]
MLVAALVCLMSQPISVDPKRLRTTVEKLASYHTRHTLTTGLTEAAEWVASQYNAIPGVSAEVMTYTIPKGRRVPEDKQVVEVVATLKGETDRVVLVGGHLDSINMKEEGFEVRAPGANDDGSGVALALECARVLAGTKPRNTIKFVAFSGEEQGLNGSRALSKKAKDEGWKLEAVLSNDMVGNSSNNNGQKDDRNVRVFSEETTPENPNWQSRELARFIEFATRGKVPKFGIKLVMRRDRFGRGGDHTP